MSEAARKALVRLRRLHTVIAIALTAFVIAGSAVATPSDGVQAIILLVAVALFGVPHGALDHLAGRSALESRLGHLWLPIFLVLYLAVCAGVVLLWLQFPLVMLLSFLAVATLHFGSEDAGPAGTIQGHHRRRVWIRQGEILGRGAMPIVIPSAVHPSEVGRIFDTLGLGSTPVTGEELSLMIGAAWPVLFIVLGPMVVDATGRALRAHSTEPLSGLIELPVLAAALSLLPPLVGFVVYFVGWHAVRHTLVWVVRLNANNPIEGIMSFAQLALPLTLATIALGWGAWMWMDNAPTDRALQVIFVGLAALTFPHVALEVAVSASNEH
ncbi:MAG: Brp/Blh family beta-carotene 15,15'-dioxygenase [Longimicrobiales bacterium]|nr:Brp/Blh family beta-carotene 15,15'-dioxygenase [Longimicrobiales bacterium]